MLNAQDTTRSWCMVSKNTATLVRYVHISLLKRVLSSIKHEGDFMRNLSTKLSWSLNICSRDINYVVLYIFNDYLKQFLETFHCVPFTCIYVRSIFHTT